MRGTLVKKILISDDVHIAMRWLHNWQLLQETCFPSNYNKIGTVNCVNSDFYRFNDATEEDFACTKDSSLACTREQHKALLINSPFQMLKV